MPIKRHASYNRIVTFDCEVSEGNNQSVAQVIDGYGDV